jgi:hypothetical protein
MFELDDSSSEEQPIRAAVSMGKVIPNSFIMRIVSLRLERWAGTHGVLLCPVQKFSRYG